jgi:hypothetical protein
VSPEQVRVWLPSTDGHVMAGRHGAPTGARTCYLGCLILGAGSGLRLAPPVTAGLPALMRGPVVTADMTTRMVS